MYKLNLSRDEKPNTLYFCTSVSSHMSLNAGSRMSANCPGLTHRSAVSRKWNNAISSQQIPMFHTRSELLP
jgi:hypothetical protein